jgi:gamma-butyrobetaine dioxygenase
MTDGLAVVDELATRYPDDYEALTTLRWVFFNRSKDDDHRWSGPMIDHGAPGEPLTLRAFYPVRGFPDMAAEDIPRAYAAMRRFSQVAHDPALQMRYPFAVGDLVGFDNRRVLHGRDAFDAVSGTRHLRGTYIDHDDVYSRLRVLRRRSEQRSRD